MVRANVAFHEICDSRVAIVEVVRGELGDQKQQQALQLRLSKAHQFQGFLVVLGVPHDGLLEADFVAPQYIATALKKMGWIRLKFQPVELTFQHEAS